MVSEKAEVRRFVPSPFFRTIGAAVAAAAMASCTPANPQQPEREIGVVTPDGTSRSDARLESGHVARRPLRLSIAAAAREARRYESGRPHVDVRTRARRALFGWSADRCGGRSRKREAVVGGGCERARARVAAGRDGFRYVARRPDVSRKRPQSRIRACGSVFRHRIARPRSPMPKRSIIDRSAAAGIASAHFDRGWDVALVPASAAPVLPNVFIREVPDPHTALLSLQKGDLDVVYGFPAKYLAEARDRSVESRPEKRTGLWCGFALGSPPEDRICPP